MNRTQKFLAGATMPAVLAIGAAAGVAFAQMPGEDRHGDGADANHMMNPEGMQDHMVDILGNDAYQRMLDAMGNHAVGMPMDMSDMDDMMAAMQACMGMDGAMTPGVLGAGQHNEHHPTAGR